MKSPILGESVTPAQEGYSAIASIKAEYPFVVITVDGKPINRKIHSLVAAAFIGPRPYKHDVNHKNGVKTVNRPGNLEYATRGKNLQHAFAIGLKSHKGECHPKAKYSETQILDVLSLIKQGVTQREIATLVKIPVHVVADVSAGRNWGHLRA